MFKRYAPKTKNQLFAGSIGLSLFCFVVLKWIFGAWISVSLVFALLMFFLVLTVVIKAKSKQFSLPETQKKDPFSFSAFIDEFDNLLKNPNSRKIFFFLCANLSFTFVELFFGWWTNSLGLVSDAFHMMFDSFAMAVSLWSTVIQLWAPDENYTYGYNRIQILSGFLNSLFLCFISFSIFFVSIKRFISPPLIHTERLFIVAILGFLINIFGLYCFHDHSSINLLNGHGHSHSHGHSCNHGHNDHNHGHSHGHSHNQLQNQNYNQTHSHIQQMQHYNGNQGLEDVTFEVEAHGVINSINQQQQQQQQIHQKFQQPRNQQNMHHVKNQVTSEMRQVDDENLKVLFLHILADALGSVSVIVSSTLVWLFDWHRADSVCSLIVSILIFISVYPSLINTAQILLQRLPRGFDRYYDTFISEISQIEGVTNCDKIHVWSNTSNNVVGSLHINVAPYANEASILKNATSILQNAGIQHITLQINKRQGQTF